MSRAQLDGPTEEEWVAHRETLTQWYWKENLPLRRVAQLMEEKYGFVAKKNQYEKYLNGRWKLTKKTSSSVWKVIAPIVFDLNRRGCRFELWINQEKKSIRTIQKETRRYARSDDVSYSSTTVPTRLPKGVVIRKISSRTQSPVMFDLPFFTLEQYLRVNLPIMRAKQVCNVSKSGSYLEHSANDVSLIKLPEVLHVAVLDPNEDDSLLNQPLAGSSVWIFQSVPHRNVLFALANNFAGLRHVSTDTINHVIRVANNSFSKLLSSNQDDYTVSALAQAIFRYSIQNGYAQIVDLLLGQSIPNLTPDYAFIVAPGKQTGLEIAVTGGHTDLVKVLLKRGADPNLTFHAQNISHSRGAMTRLIETMHTTMSRRCENFSSQIFEVLMASGADMDIADFKRLIRIDRKGHLVSAVLFRDAAEKHEKWTAQRVFNKVFKYQGDEILKQTLSIMHQYKVSVNRGIEQQARRRRIYSKDHRIYYHPGTLVDIVTRRGSLAMCQYLHRCGALLTDLTLVYALSSGCQPLVQFVLDQLSLDESVEVDWDEALAIAISSCNPHTIEYIAPYCLEARQSFKHAIKAASEMGNWIWFRRLYDITFAASKEQLSSPNIENIFDGHLLENALAYCIRDEQASIARMLMDDGICCSRVHVEKITILRPVLFNLGTIDQERIAKTLSRKRKLECPLIEALKNRNHMLVAMLLDAGARLRADDIERALTLAVESEDCLILKNILEHVATLRKPVDDRILVAAICRNDREMLNQIMNTRISIFSNDQCTYADNHCHLPTALEAAVDSQDINMIKHVLQLGVDPHNPSALFSAFLQCQKILDLLLQRHAIVYPAGRSGWGGWILVECIRRSDPVTFRKMVQHGADPNELVFLDKHTQPRNGVPAGAQKQGSISCFGYAIGLGTDGFEYVEHLLQPGQVISCTPESIVHKYKDDVKPGGFCESLFETALLAAIKFGHVPTITLLIKHNADVNFPAKRSIRRTPLQQAAEEGKLDIVQLLLDHGADVNGPPALRAGGTALQLASIKGYIKIAVKLLEYGADVRAPRAKVHGRTALEGASEHGRLDTVALLLKYAGPYDPEQREEFVRAIFLAKESGFEFIADLLNQHMTANSLEFDEFIDFEPSY